MPSPALTLLLISAPLLAPGPEPVPPPPPAPITLEEARVAGGWFLYTPHEGSLEQMAVLFARIDILRQARHPEGLLAAVLLEDLGPGGGLRAEVGYIVQAEPGRVFPGYLVRPIAPCRAAVGRAHGSWGDAMFRAKEVRAWAEARRLKAAGPARLVFLGRPQEPGELSWQVLIPVVPEQEVGPSAAPASRGPDTENGKESP